MEREPLEIILSECIYGFGNSPEKGRNYRIKVVPNGKDEPINQNQRFDIHPVNDHFILLGQGSPYDTNCSSYGRFGVEHTEEKALEKMYSWLKEFTKGIWDHYKFHNIKIKDETKDSVLKDIKKPFFYLDD